MMMEHNTIALWPEFPQSATMSCQDNITFESGLQSQICVATFLILQLIKNQIKKTLIKPITILLISNIIPQSIV